MHNNFILIKINITETEWHMNILHDLDYDGKNVCYCFIIRNANIITYMKWIHIKSCQSSMWENYDVKSEWCMYDNIARTRPFTIYQFWECL